MSSTVAALYDTRAEAETAHARLSAEVKASNLRILTRETVAALSSLRISAKDAETYRDGLNRGAVLLVGEVAAGEDPDRVVSILQGLRKSPVSDGRQGGAPVVAGAGGLAGTVAAQEVRLPLVQEELRVGKKQVLGGGARVRTIAREERVEQDVTLREEHLEASNRPDGRQLTLEEVRSGGLLKDRVIQVSEMREEPVIAKEAFVREEVVLSKTVTERTETIRETLRYTEADIQGLAEPAGKSRDTNRG
jgi:stress response protein YsnF